ncbi:MAG TPA: hypothetical protein DEQ02_10630 [Ruminococcaceae bacterium]|nr:hypothetical protein [Oscillospiraceae bacterium]
MNNGLDKIRVIERAELSEENYFKSLLAQAHSKDLLGDDDIERLQYECLTLLAYKTERYNSGDSSSIRVEKAVSIMDSNLFTIGLWLKTYKDPDYAAAVLRKASINDLYQKGRKRIDELVSVTKAVHKKLLGELIQTQNEFYRLTIEDGINGFFKLYYADFAAQEIHISADYPEYNPIPKFEGIEFMNAYVNALYFENEFCRNFSAEDIHHLLCGYAEDYRSLLINIYELVLTAALGCTIAGTDTRRLDINDTGKEYLRHIFSIMPYSEIVITIRQAAKELTCRFRCQSGLARYIQNSLPLIAGKIETAAREHTLDRIFFTPDFPENKPKIIFSYGEKMDDEQYRKIINEIAQCRVSQDKIAIIKQHIHSLADLEDILLDADLTTGETASVLSVLNLAEIAALLKRYPLMPQIDMIDLREEEQLLRKNLYSFIRRLSQEQQKAIVKASAAIEEA